MKIFAISDLHLSNSVEKPMDIFGGAWIGYLDEITADWHEKVGADDVVLLAGDLSWAMTLDEVKADIDWLSKLPGKKVIIRGNHDLWWSSYGRVKDILPEGIYAIQNNSARIGDVLIAGTRGWTIADENSDEHDQKIFKREQERLKLTLADMKKNVKVGDRAVLMLHYPPFNARFDDSEFTQIIDSFAITDTVVYGHLHGKNCRSEIYVKKGGVTYVLTSCDQIQNKLIELDVKPHTEDV